MGPILSFVFRKFAFLIPDNKTIPQGAATQVFAVLHPDASAPTTMYLMDCHEEKTHKAGASEELAQKLWEESMKIVCKF
jgi:hypothetical protein